MGIDELPRQEWCNLLFWRESSAGMKMSSASLLSLALSRPWSWDWTLIIRFNYKPLKWELPVFSVSSFRLCLSLARVLVSRQVERPESKLPLSLPLSPSPSKGSLIGAASRKAHVGSPFMILWQASFAGNESRKKVSRNLLYISRTLSLSLSLNSCEKSPPLCARGTDWLRVSFPWSDQEFLVCNLLTARSVFPVTCVVGCIYRWCTVGSRRTPLLWMYVELSLEIVNLYSEHLKESLLGGLAMCYHQWFLDCKPRVEHCQLATSDCDLSKRRCVCLQRRFWLLNVEDRLMTTTESGFQFVLPLLSWILCD